MCLDVAGDCFGASRRAGEDAQERSHLRGAWENGHATQLAKDGRQGYGACSESGSCGSSRAASMLEQQMMEPIL